MISLTLAWSMADADEAVSDDARLLAAACRGDAGAQRQIFERNKDRLASQVLRMTGDRGAVDDLVQEVFISAFSALNAFRGDAKLNTWLYRIACNKVHNWWDSQRRRRAREMQAVSRSQECPLEPDESLEAEQHRAALYRALGAIDPRLREAFVARNIEGMSLLEASAALGVPVSTVSYRTRRAEAVLCELLGIEGSDS